ncbi:MAG: hypothetical protein AAGD00_11260 [Planctomycetota bacterium]
MTTTSHLSAAFQPAVPNPRHARCVLKQRDGEQVILTVAGTSYELHLSTYKPLETPIGKRVVGVIRAQAKRIDVVNTGGRYIEPVYGRPRRVQGVVVDVDASEQSVTVNAGVPIICKTDGRQRAEHFEVGQFVSFDVERGATFTPVA